MFAVVGSWILGKLTQFGGKLIGWLFILLGIVGFILYWHRLIVASERGEQAAKALEATGERKNLDRKVDAMPDRAVRDLLRAQQSRFKRQL